jgi:LytS/YehU family sensor histidine kinase
VTWHHIGIPVALIVLLQDYRFLLLDTFIRFLMNSALAAIYVISIFLLNQRFHIVENARSSAFVTGVALVSLCLSLILFADIRNALQRWIGSVIFRRNNLDECIRKIARSAAAARSEEELLSAASREIAAHLRTEEFTIVKDAVASRESDQPALIITGQAGVDLPTPPAWAEVQVPLRFSSGEVCFLVTGSRRGRQRYLSEDLEDMRRLGSVIVEQVERFRSAELRRLATQAELSALQAQINPHFLFNAFNTLYGSIDRGSFEARRMVLNLADIFRYFLQGDRTYIPLSEELRIVQAYLEIETLRLGDRLETCLHIDESVSAVMIPILCIQPIVENAVKHGIVPGQKGGRITLEAHIIRGNLHVSVEDTGVGFQTSNAPRPGAGTGMGLDNVRRRLHLSFGPEAKLTVRSCETGSTVSFVIPASRVRRDTDVEVVADASTSY